MIAEARHADIPVDPEGMRANAKVYADYQRTLRDGNAADLVISCFGQHERCSVTPNTARAGQGATIACLPTSIRTSTRLSNTLREMPERAGPRWTMARIRFTHSHRRGM